MKLKFDSGLEYQLEAINSVTDLFEGLPQAQSELSIKLGTETLYTSIGLIVNLKEFRYL